MEHHFNVGMAKEYGIEESILIHNLYYWIKHNVVNKKHFHDERYWTYNTADAFAQLFQYMNSSKIYRVLKSLEDKNIIIKGNYNEDKHDRTNWYSFTNDALAILKENGYEIDGFSSSFQNDEMHFSKMENGICENAKCYNIDIDNIPNINTNNKQKEKDINISSKKDELFEECWKAYNRKGSKKQSKAQWAKLSDDEKQSIMPHIKSYTSSREINYQKDFERYLRDKIFNEVIYDKSGQVVFDPQKCITSDYMPQQSPMLNWNEYYNCYMYVGYWDGHIPDGYSDDDRPNGASVTLNNGRGTIVWDKETKQWIKK